MPTIEEARNIIDGTRSLPVEQVAHMLDVPAELVHQARRATLGVPIIDAEPIDDMRPSCAYCEEPIMDSRYVVSRRGLMRVHVHSGCIDAWETVTSSGIATPR